MIRFSIWTRGAMLSFYYTRLTNEDGISCSGHLAVHLHTHVHIQVLIDKTPTVDHTTLLWLIWLLTLLSIIFCDAVTEWDCS